ncbi:MAG: protein-L-isoaspartate(D-aspartate) O-methyltransferase [Candidatus Nezhaarchaeota archaeon]|nr:protein-L-isoaspartate(D-aspartate) O-methyltransferase [Candidatus Nezhaarchaeota archaeon]MCX8141732.1 protein-L-isoaspartate(D-aspartate) O-methyltransferase [Candidatus Nezhaarchaeota archaeon]MDW8050490.1 protein-L-isoaspartate(D-aspartate) O-methyltransferase [Nitrososphaerota archaeon]
MPKNLEAEKRRVIQSLIEAGVIKRKIVADALLKVPREEFIPREYRDYAYVDRPIPIGYGQTTSALHMVAWMCEAAELKPGDKVLEVGGGCGYMAAVYAEIVAPHEGSLKGHVYTIEIVGELARRAEENLGRLNYLDRVTVIHGDGSLGYPQAAPYDAIIVTAASPGAPKPLKEQLKVNGRLVIPIGSPYYVQELMLIRRLSEGDYEEKELGGCVFVPLRGKYGWSCD